MVLSSPSGTGKTSLARALLDTEDNLFLSISATTRAPRPRETEGKSYFFMTPEDFRERLLENYFLEHAEVFGHLYGTPAPAVMGRLACGEDVLFDIDWQGAAQLLRTFPNRVVSIFLLPPSSSELERRLRSRGQDTEDVIQYRLSQSCADLQHWQEYTYIVVNDDFSDTVAHLREILHAERAKRERLVSLDAFIRNFGFSQK